jgi:hypothetical protein
VLRPKAGDCRVFCSYGSVKCPPVHIQKGSSCGVTRSRRYAASTARLAFVASVAAARSIGAPLSRRIHSARARRFSGM